MATSRLTPEQIAQVSGLVAQYITTQREKYTPRATQLPAQQKAKMAGFFSPPLLDDGRLHVAWTVERQDTFSRARSC